jgi:hypothetical protein
MPVINGRPCFLFERSISRSTHYLVRYRWFKTAAAMASVVQLFRCSSFRCNYQGCFMHAWARSSFGVCLCANSRAVCRLVTAGRWSVGNSAARPWLEEPIKFTTVSSLLYDCKQPHCDGTTTAFRKPKRPTANHEAGNLMSSPAGNTLL